MTVLVVEDSEALREELCQIYRQLGFEALEAEDGQSALLILQELKSKNKLPDLISSDVNMPNMDGVTLLNKIRSIKEMKQLPFIIFTANKDELFRVTAQCLMVNGYYLKPVDKDKLQADLIKLFPGKNFKS